MSGQVHSTQTALAFDFGLKYIGVAIGQSMTKDARPLTTIPAKSGIPHWPDIQQLIELWQPNCLVVGLPLNRDGSYQHISHCAKKFANRLREKFKLPVEFIDEFLSTQEAKQYISHFDPKNKKDLQQINAISAAILLERWYLSQ